MPGPLELALTRPDMFQNIRDALQRLLPYAPAAATAAAPFAAPAAAGLGTAALVAPAAFTLLNPAMRANAMEALQGASATAQEAARRFTPWGRTVFPEASVAAPAQRSWSQSLQPMLSQGNDFTLVSPPSAFPVGNLPATMPGEFEASIPWGGTANRAAPLDVPIPQRAAPTRSAAPFQMQTWDEPQAVSTAAPMPTYYGNDAFPTLQAPPLPVPADVPTRRHAAGTATRSATAQQAAPRYQDVTLGGRYVAPMQTYQDRPAVMGTASTMPSYYGQDAVATPIPALPYQMQTWESQPTAAASSAPMPTYYGQDALPMPQRARPFQMETWQEQPVAAANAAAMPSYYGQDAVATPIPAPPFQAQTWEERPQAISSPAAAPTYIGDDAYPMVAAPAGAPPVEMETWQEKPVAAAPTSTMPTYYGQDAVATAMPSAPPFQMQTWEEQPAALTGDASMPTYYGQDAVATPITGAPVVPIPMQTWQERPQALVGGVPMPTYYGQDYPTTVSERTDAVTVPLDVPVPESIPRTRTGEATTTLPLDVPVPERIPRERAAESEAAVAPLDVPLPERIPRTVAPGAEAITVPPGPVPPNEELVVPFAEPPEKEKPKVAGRAAGVPPEEPAEAAPAAPAAAPAPAVADWGDDDWTTVTESVLGEPISGGEMNEWLRNFAAEHGNRMPWEVGPGDAAGNFIDHLLALGESRAAANQGQDVNQTWWEKAYADRYPGEFQPYQAATGLAGAPDAQSLLNTIQGLITNLGVGQSAYNQYVGR